MTATDFRALMARITDEIAGAPIDAALADRLNARHGVGSDTYARVVAACEAGIAEGWMCKHANGDVRYGRVVKPGDDTHGFSVDVVDMADCAGAAHRHPNGEIVLTMPLAGDARFCGHPAGWSVSGPGSRHVPEVSGGRALVLYLLPQGAIEFNLADAA